MGGLAGVALRERGPAPGLGSSWARRAAWAGAVRCGRDGADAAWVAEDVEHLLWEFTPDIHESLENLCDVVDTSPYFLGQPGLQGRSYDATGPSREACMMHGQATDPEAGVVPAAGGGDPVQPPDGVQPVSRDSMIHYAMLAAGHPEVITGLEYSEQVDEQGGSDVVTALSTSLAQVASCMWNPEWAHLATVSMTSARPSPSVGVGGAPWGYEGMSRWCPSGSAFIGGSTYTAVEATDPRRGACGDLGINVEHEPNNCVRASQPGTLRMAMNPERLIPVEPEWVGKRVRAEVVVGNLVERSQTPSYWSDDPSVPATEQAGPLQNQSCYAAWGWRYGTHAWGSSYPDVIRGGFYFSDGTGVLSSPMGPVSSSLSCDAPQLDLSGPENVAEVRPLYVNYVNSPLVVVTFEAEVPEGAVGLGLRVDVAGVESSLSEPVISDTTIQLSVPTSPGVRKDLLEQGASAFLLDPALQTYQHELPHRCESPSWFRATSETGSPAMFPTESSCLVQFAP
jgi:hypothetical protein